MWRLSFFFFLWDLELSKEDDEEFMWERNEEEWEEKDVSESWNDREEVSNFFTTIVGMDS